MIIEMRSYILQPGGVPVFEEAFEKALEHRTKFSPLGAFFHTDIGPLNQVVHIWPYESFDEKDRIGKEARATGHWPPKAQHVIVTQESKVLQAAPFSPPLEPRKLGEVYEMRTYTVKPGTMPKMLETWGKSLVDRTKLSPLAACWTTAYGPLNQFIHVWPYKDLAERARIRAEATKLDSWPPKTREYLLHQENKILIPTAFSPLH